MAKIYKYQLEKDISEVKTQIKQVLAFQVQDGIPTVWVEIDENLPYRNIEFQIIGTGWNFNSFGYTYLNTIQLHGFVWHCYYKIGEAE